MLRVVSLGAGWTKAVGVVLLILMGGGRSLKPYFQAAGITLYHGDAREVLPAVAGARPVDDVVVVTDPVWPNAHPDLAGAEDPVGLFLEVARLFPTVSSRCVIQLGRDSDPRFLSGVPASMPFLCACWLRRTPPGHKGDILIAADIAYVFGNRRRPRGVRVFPGEGQVPSSGARLPGDTHPAPRNARGVEWLFRWFVPEGCSVVEPFSGSGTTLVVAYRRGVEAVGCEVEERWCEQSARRLEVEMAQGRLGLEVHA